MLTKNEITALNLSPTKKDFVQIWNELLEVAGRLSERWDPTSTNESDPGIVILKALTGIADKLNYNIDKNILEAFMPTAAQEESMRKLCDMLGYNVKYYRSAVTDVTFKYHPSDPSEDEVTAMSNGILIPKFTVLSNSDQDISYFTINQTDLYISSVTPYKSIPCMEGQIVRCESTTDNNVITANQISDNNRFYLPEYRIAENGIFVYNVAGNREDGDRWERVDNLNICPRGERVFKFGYDSYEGRPYLEFPEDWSSLINDGLFIYYTRTSGANGNISARTLSQFETPTTEGWDKVSIGNFSVENNFAATTGSDIETIGQAYNNFKKTIGTFETLVTCRDYMNKIYTMTDENTGKYLVSNALVTDIRNDLNRVAVICSCDDAGIFYKETPLSRKVSRELKLESSNEFVKVEDQEPLISHFDIVLYPFKSYNQIRNNIKDVQEAYDVSFKYDKNSFDLIKNQLNNGTGNGPAVKTIAHNIVSPRANDLISINNYLKLNAIIGTTSKVTEEEGSLLKEKIKIALANAFNMRELDFGEEIPFDSILSVIKNADSRISVVSLAEPALYTTFSVLEDFDKSGNPILKEYAVASEEWLTKDYADSTNRFEDKKTFDTAEARKIYNRLVVRNILAGRVPLFKYNTTFRSNFSEAPYRITVEIDKTELPDNLTTQLEPTAAKPFTIYVFDGVTYTGQLINNEAKYTKTYVPKKYIDNVITKNKDDDNNIVEIITSCKITAPPSKNGEPQQISDVTLADGEFIKFRAPNFLTKKTYPAYVNYHLELAKEIRTPANFADANSLYSLINTPTEGGLSADEKRQRILDYFAAVGQKKTFTLIRTINRSTVNSNDNFSIVINNPTASEVTETPESILLKSSFIRLVNNNAVVKWVATDVGGPSVSVPPLELREYGLNNNTSFITSPAVFGEIQEKIDNWLAELEKTSPDELPVDAWTVEYTFEYVPFDVTTLSSWETFISSPDAQMFGFLPQSEYGTVLWYIHNGSYSPGKLVLSSGAKLLPFSSGYFNILEENRLASIYIAKELGKDLEPNFIDNNEDYMLKDNEYLYIEYTPSSITEDGTTQEQSSVQEVYEKGTIIRPSGFIGGLKDSSIQDELGTSSHKTADFKTSAGSKGGVQLYSLGASEQIEIRELAQVVLDANALPNSPAIYVYKNFNDCEYLETTNKVNEYTGKRSYTLKDGEYIFYTDQNKSEFAYFSSGTEVILTGDVIIPKFEIVDLASIFEGGIQAIPWAHLYLANGESINFQEYQYITLGAGDTLNALKLAEHETGKDEEGNNKEYCLDEHWRACTGVLYTVVGTDTPKELPKVNISGTKSCGWEACSLLELSTSPDKAQTLRKTDTVETSIALYKPHSSGVDLGEPYMVVTADVNALSSDKIVSTAPAVSVKANLTCQSTNGKLNISDLYFNPNKIKSFELKVFSAQEPAIVKVSPNPNALVPVTENNEDSIIDITAWPTDTSEELTAKINSNLWTRVDLFKLDSDAADYENALKLPICLLPNTYGIFSIYLNSYDIVSSSETWIELLPGAEKTDIALLNADAEWNDKGETLKLKLNPGINCIRVNRTCDIFIRTTAKDGILLFDNLRLVDCQNIEYTDEYGQAVHLATHGINLDQLGYLYVPDTEEEVNSNLGSLQAKASEPSTLTQKEQNMLYICKLEEQLLREIQDIDRNREFYYNIPVESHMAINFNEGTAKLNTLMNPAINYDINNINNNFVISKLDINYIAAGLQIARSSKI